MSVTNQSDVHLIRSKPAFVRLAANIALILASWIACTCSAGADESFEKVLTVLQSRCFECHSHASGEAEGGLVLDSLSSMQAGGAGGNVLAGGKKSLLLKAISYDVSRLQMPPDGKLDDKEIAILREWIDAGTPVPDSFVGTAPAKEAASISGEDHWAFQPISSQETPATGHPVDFLINKVLTGHGLKQSRRAVPTSLMRRLHYDLIGLPPSAEILASTHNSGTIDVGAVCDELLANEQFGERWARYWMDVARYADNKGYVFREDREYPEAYKYRDWLIRSLNKDMPYDEFLKHQIAADVIPDATPDNIPALGFLTLGRRFLNNQNDIIDDRIDVVSRGLMGLTVSCARCHDHKYDPVTQKDYYGLYGVFLNAQEPGGEPWPHRLVDREELIPSFVLIRGQRGNRGEKAPRRFVSFLNRTATDFQQGSGRLELAERIASAENPLTARVIANRVWMHLTGHSIVESPSDLGLRCPEPAHSELLDHLASYLIANDWSLKSLIKHIVTSEAYQQSSHTLHGQEADPANELFWRMNIRRLDFEASRDTLLLVADQLDSKLFGPSERIESKDFSRRRSVYAYIDRQNLPSVFRTFDLASPDAHSARRAETSVPQQGLFLMNSPFVAELAIGLAEKISAEVPMEDRERWARAVFKQILRRPPSKSELKGALDLLSHEPRHDVVSEQWICGYGPFNVETSRLEQFTPLPHFTGAAWQGGKDLPDTQLGWCTINDIGGHPGNDLEHAVVRRWVAPEDGSVSIAGRVIHKNEPGDGVRATIIHGIGETAEQHGQWQVHNSRADTLVPTIRVKAGDTIDFVTDCFGGVNHDSFEWKVRVFYNPGTREYRSEKQLPEPLPEALSSQAVLCQALMISNELNFID